MRSALLAAFLLALVPVSASAGGFATVGLESPPPQRISAGDSWGAEFTVQAHGRTPAPGLDPRVVIEDSGGEVETFPAVAGDKPGSYRADVVFPSDGRYDITIVDGYANQRHTFPAVTVGEGGPNIGESPQALLVSLAAGLLAALLSAGLIALAGRRRGGAAHTASAA
jgi:hypothetical protein